jgi:hypothetical protein
MRLPNAARRAQDRLLRSFGRVPGDRASVVRAMRRRPDGDATGYWLQLTIATMLATLGHEVSVAVMYPNTAKP